MTTRPASVLAQPILATGTVSAGLRWWRRGSWSRTWKGRPIPVGAPSPERGKGDRQLAVSPASFQPDVWVTFAAATVAVAVTYVMIGVVWGRSWDRLGGLYLMFLLPFLDVGLAQNIMFDAAPPSWTAWMTPTAQSEC